MAWMIKMFYPMIECVMVAWIIQMFYPMSKFKSEELMHCSPNPSIPKSVCMMSIYIQSVQVTIRHLGEIQTTVKAFT